MSIKSNRIQVNILSDEEMKRIGFTDYSKENWYFMRMIKQVRNISFNVTINKKTKDLNIEVLDDSFGQPYDYQYILKENPKFKPCLIVKEQVEDIMKYLEDNGVLTGHTYGEYI